MVKNIVFWKTSFGSQKSGFLNLGSENDTCNMFRKTDLASLFVCKIPGLPIYFVIYSGHTAFMERSHRFHAAKRAHRCFREIYGRQSLSSFFHCRAGVMLPQRWLRSLCGQDIELDKSNLVPWVVRATSSLQPPKGNLYNAPFHRGSVCAGRRSAPETHDERPCLTRRSLQGSNQIVWLAHKWSPPTSRLGREWRGRDQSSGKCFGTILGNTQVPLASSPATSLQPEKSRLRAREAALRPCRTGKFAQYRKNRQKPNLLLGEVVKTAHQNFTSIQRPHRYI